MKILVSLFILFSFKTSFAFERYGDCETEDSLVKIHYLFGYEVVGGEIQHKGEKAQIDIQKTHSSSEGVRTVAFADRTTFFLNIDEDGFFHLRALTGKFLRVVDTGYCD